MVFIFLSEFIQLHSSPEKVECGIPETSARSREAWKLHFNFNCKVLLNILVERPTEQIVGHLSLNKEELQPYTHTSYLWNEEHEPSHDSENSSVLLFDHVLPVVFFS